METLAAQILVHHIKRARQFFQIPRKMLYYYLFIYYLVEMINERRKYKNATDHLGREKYISLRNAINRECRKSCEEAFLDGICTEVGVQLKSGQMDKAYI